MHPRHINDYVIIRSTVIFDPTIGSTFAGDVQRLIDRGYQPYGKPILTPEFRPDLGPNPTIVGYQTMVKYAESTKQISNNS